MSPIESLKSCSAYRSRPCPSCGGRVLTTENVRSDPCLEDTSFDELLRQWNTDIFTYKGFFSYVRCRNCKLLYCPVYPDDAQLARLYGSMKPNMSELPDQCCRKTQAGYLLAALRHGHASGGYLEIGPDRGFLASEAAERSGFDRFWFIEPNVVVHDSLRSVVAPKPCDISVDPNYFAHIPDGCCTLAFMVHVLDHLTSPLHHLSEILRCLKPGGLLSIVVHNERSLLARAFGANHPIFCPYHPQLFNQKTLAALLERAGFNVLEVTRTRNHYPLGYLARNAAFRVGLGGTWIPQLRSLALPLPLGNIQVTARKGPLTVGVRPSVSSRE
jgi:SAM-dependent methyltransferase